EEVRMHGAATVADRAVTPRKSAAENATGDTIVIVVNNAGKGLIDLAASKCGASMSSVILETTVQGAKKLPEKNNVDILKLKMHVIKNNEIAFILNPKTGMVNRPLGFITIGEPSEKVRRVIEVYKVNSQK